MAVSVDVSRHADQHVDLIMIRCSGGHARHEASLDPVRTGRRSTSARIKMENLRSYGIEHETLSITLAAMQHTAHGEQRVGAAHLGAINRDIRYADASLSF